MGYKLLTYSSSRGPRAGLLLGERVIDAADATGRESWSTVMGVLESWDDADAAFSRLVPGDGIPLADIQLLAPILYPGQVYCAGANYQDHVEEMARAGGREPGKNMKELGELPWFFIKSGRSSIVGPGATVKLPAYSKAVDWEIELAAVIGRTARDVAAKDALACVAGYTIANDLSARDMARRGKVAPDSAFHFDWLSQKCFDGACPIGPWIVPARDVGDPHDLGMQLWIGEELMQDSNTGRMIFGIAEQIEMISSRVTLYPGDVVLTGTPAGVGAARKRFLRPGERLRLVIDGIGELRHAVA